MAFEKVWDSIVLHAGLEFRQKQGKVFTYRVDGN
jgi:hypothetical protein